MVVRCLAAWAAMFATMVAAYAQPTLSCAGAQKPGTVIELMFGRNIGGRVGVTESKWARFLDREITPRFPDGLSVYDVRGQWRDAKRNVIVREPSKIVMIAIPGGLADEAPVQQIISAYKRQFHQQSFGLIVRPACIAF